MLLHDKVETLPEKFYRLGAAGLSPTEVLALCLGDDTTGRAWRLLNGGELLSLMKNRLVWDVAQVVGESEAIRLAAAMEIGRRCYETTPTLFLNQPETVVEYVIKHIGMCAKEHFMVLALNNRQAVLGHEIAYVGQVASISIRVAEIFRFPVACCASRIIVAHNHPSHDPTPSPEDVKTTKEILTAGKILGIPVDDHVVVSGKKFVSMYRDYQYLWNNH